MNKNIKLFSTDSARTTYENSASYETPYVSKVAADNSVHYNKDPFNGHAYVDLKLPSGTLWATMNVGATKEVPNSVWSIDSDCTGTAYTFSNLSQAVAEWGGEWEVPTKEQWEELNQYTNSSHPFIFESQGEHMYLPLTYYDGAMPVVYAARCWSSDEKDSNNAYYENLYYYGTNNSYYKNVASYSQKSQSHYVRLVINP